MPLPTTRCSSTCLARISEKFKERMTSTVSWQMRVPRLSSRQIWRKYFTASKDVNNSIAAGFGCWSVLNMAEE